MHKLTECRQHDFQHITQVLLQGLQRPHSTRTTGVYGRNIYQLPAAAARHRRSTSCHLHSNSWTQKHDGDAKDVSCDNMCEL
jgi:hypothetical protein